MKKRILIIVASCTALMFTLLPAASFAVDVIAPVCTRADSDGTSNSISGSSVCKDAADGQTKNPLFGPDGVLTRAIFILSIVIAVIAVIVIIVAGIRFAVSQGEAQKITAVRNTIIYAIVGLAVAALAQGIVQLVLNKLT